MLTMPRTRFTDGKSDVMMFIKIFARHYERYSSIQIMIEVISFVETIASIFFLAKHYGLNSATKSNPPHLRTSNK